MEPYVTFTDDTILEGTVPQERSPEGLPLAPILVKTPSVPIPEQLEGTKTPDSRVPLAPQETEEPAEVPAVLAATVSDPAEESGIPWALSKAEGATKKLTPVEVSLEGQPLQRSPRRNQPLWWPLSASWL